MFGARERVDHRLIELRLANRIEFAADPSIAGATEVYVPLAHYRNGFTIRFEGVPAMIERSASGQFVRIRALKSGPAWLSIEPVTAT